jgi:hypothetical protein
VKVWYFLLGAISTAIIFTAAIYLKFKDVLGL